MKKRPTSLECATRALYEEIAEFRFDWNTVTSSSPRFQAFLLPESWMGL